MKYVKARLKTETDWCVFEVKLKKSGKTKKYDWRGENMFLEKTILDFFRIPRRNLLFGSIQGSDMPILKNTFNVSEAFSLLKNRTIKIITCP